MAKQSERTFKMKESYIELHEKGLSVSQIAKQFDLTPRMIYVALGDIAAKAGVSRDSLLEKPHKPHPSRTSIAVQDQSGVNLADHETYVKETLAGFDRVLENVDQYIKLQEQVAAKEENL